MFVSPKFVLNKTIRVGKQENADIHANVSLGYYTISSKGKRTFVPYTGTEKARIHTFISPIMVQKDHLKWKKTKDWSDREKAKSSKWHYHPTFNGLNTVSK